MADRGRLGLSPRGAAACCAAGGLSTLGVARVKSTRDRDWGRALVRRRGQTHGWARGSGGDPRAEHLGRPEAGATSMREVCSAAPAGLGHTAPRAVAGPAQQDPPEPTQMQHTPARIWPARGQRHRGGERKTF